MRAFHRALVASIALALFGVSVIACSSGSPKPNATTASSSTPTTDRNEVSTPTTTQPRATLEFREVRQKLSRACQPPAPGTFPDREGNVCYLLGPVLLTGTGVVSARVVYDDGLSRWAVHAQYGNNNFVTKVARPMINKTIAIVLDGVVQSAPEVNPGITGRGVQISADGPGYTRADAVRVAASIMGIARSRVP